MSIASEITRIKNNIANAYDECGAKGAIMPSHSSLEDSDHLADTISSITELRGQQVIIDEWSTFGTTFYPTGAYNGITRAKIVLHTSDLVITPSTTAQEFDVDVLSQAGPPYPPEVVNHDGLVGFRNVKVGAVTSSIDQNITPGNIKNGVEILGVTGTYTGQQPNLGSLIVMPSTSSQSIFAYDDPLGYDGYDKVYVDAVDSSIDSNIQSNNILDGVTILGVTGNVVEANLDSAVVYPSTTAQTITPVSPYNGFDEISVQAVDHNIDQNIIPSNIKNGVSILGVTGSYDGDIRSLTITPTTSQQVIDAQYDANPTTGYSPITVNAVDSSIDNNIAPNNIKNGVTILGVTGSYTGTSPVLITKSIDRDGVYNASDDNADGYSSVEVNVGGSVPPRQTAISISNGQLVFNREWIEDVTGCQQGGDLIVSPGQNVQGNNVEIRASAWGNPGTFPTYLIMGQNGSSYTLSLETSQPPNIPLAKVMCSSNYGSIDAFLSVEVERPKGYWTTSP